MALEDELQANILLKEYAAQVAASFDKKYHMLNELVEYSISERRSLLHAFVLSDARKPEAFHHDKIVRAIEKAILRLHHKKSLPRPVVVLEETPDQIFRLTGRLLYANRLKNITAKIDMMQDALDSIDDKIYAIECRLNETHGHDERLAGPSHVTQGTKRQELLGKQQFLKNEFADTFAEFKQLKKQRKILAGELGLVLKNEVATGMRHLGTTRSRALLDSNHKIRTKPKRV